MAIFGNLRDMPFPDLVSMLGKRSGILEMFAIPGKKQGYRVALDSGKIVWMQEGGRFLEPFDARLILHELFQLQEGAFEFEPGIPSPNGHSLAWPLEQLLLSFATIEDEQAATTPFLPDPKTLFQAANLDVWLEEPLYSFWEKAKPLLQNGASTEDISAKLGLPLKDVRYYLHKLRLVGKVVPVRAYQKTREDHQKQGLFRRLLTALLVKKG